MELRIVAPMIDGRGGGDRFAMRHPLPFKSACLKIARIAPTAKCFFGYGTTTLLPVSA
ncbi:hypothetical protein [Duganella levis]|uniref:Uncharacterized protein n=1 Tax=Duganella levis TaxID=2692169 RepID=A0ABW9VUU1_9BURK|nr:hypothetical protein [Duganella levis]MYN25405.1 hypothetical protein [Duganella levis]